MSINTAVEQAPESQPRNRRTRLGRFSPSNIHIKYRLPLLIGAMLFGVVIASIWASYDGVKKAALEVGRERLLNLTQQVASMLQESANSISGKTFTVASEPALRAYLRSPSTSRDDAVRVLQQFASSEDPNSWRVEVWNLNRSRQLLLPEGAPADLVDLEPEFKQSAVNPFKTLGVFRQVKDVIAYPAVAAIRDEAGVPIGYLVRWRRLAANSNARQRLQELLGTKAALYLGNKDGDIWTDLVNMTPQPPQDVRLNSSVFHYVREGAPVMALARPISGTPWYVLIEFPDSAVFSPVDKFFRRMIIIGMVLLLIGLAVAWALSRSITQPLASLTGAATAIARGHDAHLADVSTNDELGELAGAFNAMVLKVRDYQYELEQKVQNRTEQLQAANKELESFCYSVSHDLRAPLRAMNGFSRILCEEYETNLPSEAQRYLHLVRNNASQMAQLIDDLLDFSRIGRQPLRKLQVAPADLVKQALHGLESEQEGRKVIISIGTLPEVKADPSLLKIVYDNLLSNALKYTRKSDEAKIEIGATYGENGNRSPVFYVRDNGAGFDMKYANKLFGVFQRLHHAQEFEGTGVGLATAQRIIHRHGGNIWAEARVGAGATFYFTLGAPSEINEHPATPGPLLSEPPNELLDRHAEA